MKNILQMPARIRGEKFKHPPILLVIHQAIKSKGVAEYLLSRDAEQRNVSCHFAYSSNAKDFVQMVPIDTVAYHSGRSMWNGKTGCNGFSIGIELPGPIDEAIEEKVFEQLINLTHAIKKECPSIKYTCGHKHIAPGRRSDPGKFDFEKFAEICCLIFASYNKKD